MFGLNKNAVIETLVLLSALLGLSFFMDAPVRWQSMDLHPFWIVVLLVTVQYGTKEGVFACVMATLFLYVANFPVQEIEESSFDYQYRIAHLPLFWFISAFVLGELRMKSTYENQELQTKLDELQDRAFAITEAYEQIKKTKEDLESRIAGDVTTLSNTYQALKSLEELNPAKILFSLEGLIQIALDPEKFSVWAFGQHGFEVVLSYGWENDSYLRRIETKTPLFEALVNKGRMLSVTNRDDQILLEKQGILAAPLINPRTDEIFGMIKIEEIEFNKLNISNLEIFKTLCILIGKAFGNAQAFKIFRDNGIWHDVGFLYTKKMVELFGQIFAKLGLNGCYLDFDSKSLTDESLKEIGLDLLRSVQKKLPDNALIGQNRRGDKNFLVLLANYEPTDAEQLSFSLIDQLAKEFPNIRFDFKCKRLKHEEAHAKK
jgi:hypothetical protein